MGGGDLASHKVGWGPPIDGGGPPEAGFGPAEATAGARFAGNLQARGGTMAIFGGPSGVDRVNEALDDPIDGGRAVRPLPLQAEHHRPVRALRQPHLGKGRPEHTAKRCSPLRSSAGMYVPTFSVLRARRRPDRRGRPAPTPAPPADTRSRPGRPSMRDATPRAGVTDQDAAMLPRAPPTKGLIAMSTAPTIRTSPASKLTTSTHFPHLPAAPKRHGTQGARSQGTGRPRGGAGWAQVCVQALFHV